MRSPPNRGFTLLELVVTLAIVALMLSLLTPRFDDVLTTAEMKSETRKVASVLRHARSQAVLLNREVRIGLREEPALLRLDDGQVLYRPPDSLRLELTSEEETLANPYSGLSDPHIRFHAIGGASGGSVSLSLAGGRRSTISIDRLSGRVQIDE